MSELWLQGFAARDHPDGRRHVVVRLRWRLELRGRWRWRRWIELRGRFGWRRRSRGELLSARKYGGWSPRGCDSSQKSSVVPDDSLSYSPSAPPTGLIMRALIVSVATFLAVATVAAQ